MVYAVLACECVHIITYDGDAFLLSMRANSQITNMSTHFITDITFFTNSRHDYANSTCSRLTSALSLCAVSLSRIDL